MDMDRARALVVADTRLQDPERHEGRSDDVVLASLVEDGVDVAEVESWEESLPEMPAEVREAYLLVVQGL